MRYADDVVVHCTSKADAEKGLEAINRGLQNKAQIKEEKTRIAYCKDYRRKEQAEVVKFEFLGFSYQPRARKEQQRWQELTAFAGEDKPSQSEANTEVIREVKLWSNTQIEMQDIAKTPQRQTSRVDSLLW